MNISKKTLQYGKHQLTIETGEIARQASGAVIVNMDDTVVLVSAVGKKTAAPGQDFFPLTVDYQEFVHNSADKSCNFRRRRSRFDPASRLKQNRTG